MRKPPHLSENNTQDVYEETPIENYGEKIFMKMLKNSNDKFLNKKREAPKLIEFAPRNHRSGLGFNLDNSKLFHTKLEEENKLKTFYGETVYIIKGPFKSLSAKICDPKKSDTIDNLIKYNEKITVQLDVNDQVISIDTRSLSLNNPNNIESNKNDNKYNLHDSKNKYESDESKNDEEEEESEHDKKKLEWISPGLIIRIIDKSSKFFNTKATVEDLMDEYSFSVITNDQSILTNFKEDDCETVIPKIGQNVMIVLGEHKGKYAKLIERDKKNNTVIVETLEIPNMIITLTQDDVCLYQ